MRTAIQFSEKEGLVLRKGLRENGEAIYLVSYLGATHPEDDLGVGRRLI